MWTDVFYFDDASNVQKAGAVIEVWFPWTATYHGDEHAVALWFSDLAKVPEIKVCFFIVFQLLSVWGGLNIFFYFYLCLIWHVIKKYGRELSTVQR